MPQAAKDPASEAATSTAEPDLLEGERAAAAPAGSVVIALSRGVGAAARAVSDGWHGMAGLFRTRRPRRVKQPGEDLRTLLARLSELVAAHAADPATLADDEAFWQLERRLSRFQRRKHVPKRPGAHAAGAAAQPAAGAAAEPTAAEAAVAPAEPDSAAKKAAPKRPRRRTTEAAAAAPSEPVAAAAPTPGEGDAHDAGDEDQEELLLPTESEESAADAADDAAEPEQKNKS